MKCTTKTPTNFTPSEGDLDGCYPTGGKSHQPGLRQRCPLRGDVRAINELGSDLAVALRRLKRRLKRCQKGCPAYQGAAGEPCELLNDFHTQIQMAISVVMEELGQNREDAEYTGKA